MAFGPSGSRPLEMGYCHDAGSDCQQLPRIGTLAASGGQRTKRTDLFSHTCAFVVICVIHLLPIVCHSPVCNYTLFVWLPLSLN